MTGNTNVKVERSGTENALGLIRRFTKRVQGSGILPKKRSIRYYDRPKSRLVVKKKKLKALNRKEEIEELIKLGKMDEKAPRRGRRR